MKKAMELSLSTVIIAVISLIVLVVIVLIFTGQSSKFNMGLNDCKTRGGESYNCKPTAAECIDLGGTPSGRCVFYNSDGSKMIDTDDVCCVFR